VTDTVRTIADLRRRVAAWRAAGDRVALVPTMGALHAGHIALVAAAQADDSRVIVSIFVNPTQFAPSEDFDRYPRQEAADRAQLERAGADLLFAPNVTEMYPSGFVTAVRLHGSLVEHLDAVHRPGHFEGVATIVTKLLLQALPDAAYFGEKDYQQLQVITRLAADLDIPTRIVGVPTDREPDGLARSSRNAYLTADQRRAAAALPAILRRTAAAIAAGANVADSLASGRAALCDAGFGPIDFLALCDAATLEPLTALTARPARLLVAAHLGATRLIDNLPIP
jgi:pantoate--beta-alanine ligase